MKIKQDDLFLFYIPVTCLFLMSPGAFSPWWKTYVSGPLILVLIISFMTGILLKRRHNHGVSDQDHQQSQFKSIQLVIHSEIQIGQSPDERQMLVQGTAGNWEIKFTELPGEGLAALECERLQSSQSETDQLMGEILVDSGEIWIRDSVLDAIAFQLVDWQAGDPTVRLIIDPEQQVRGTVICPPYGDGTYRFEKMNAGFKLELITEVFSDEATRR